MLLGKLNAFNMPDDEMTDIIHDVYGKVKNDIATYEHRFAELTVDINDNCYGTADIVAYDSYRLFVGDLKYGLGLVHAKDNTQLMLYAVGALRDNTQEITMKIYQPRRFNYSEHTLTREELLSWYEDNKENMEKAYNQVEEYNKGDWCRWCKGDC